MPLASNLAGLVLAVLLSAGGFSYTFSNEARPTGEAFVEVSAKGGDLPAMDVTIKGDGQTIKKKVPPLKSGEKHRIDWVQQTPRASYTMELAGPGIQGKTNFEIVKATEGAKSTGPGRIIPKCSREDIVDRRTAKFQVVFDVKSYEFNVYDTSGAVAHTKTGGSGEYGNGDILEFTWPELPLFMVELKAVGEQGQTGAYRLVPWQVDIPHVDVIFDSGKAVIKEGEAPKVDKAFDAAVKELVALERINEAVGDNITAQLYIIGYTDTVGNAGKNQKLSRGRAKAIAEYFKKKGIWCEIFYAGMGENGLAVPTGDNVDEARNRRAAYILTAQKPPPSGKIPAKWTQLAGARKRPANIKVPATATLSSPELPASDASSGGGESGSSGDSGEDSSVGGGTSDEGSEETYDNWEDALGNEEHPPSIEDEPGATKKGCAVDPASGTGAGGLSLATLIGLVGLARRRRRA